MDRGAPSAIEARRVSSGPIIPERAVLDYHRMGCGRAKVSLSCVSSSSRLSVLALVQHCMMVVFREAPLHRAYDMGCNTWLCDLASRTDRHSSWISGLSLTSFASAMPLFCAAVGFPMLLRLPR